MRVEPLTPDGVVEHVVGRVLARAGEVGCEVGGEAAEGVGERPVRVLVDGHPSTRPEDLADALVAPLRAAGRPVARVRVRDFLRPASLRLERGRRDPDALLEEWIDVGGLNREVLTGVVARGRWLPSLRDPATDRATRAAYVDAAPDTVVVLDGSLATGRGLDVDLVVHLALRPATETRNTPLDDAWTLAAYGRYRREAQPERRADVVVRVDHPDRPALLLPG